MGRIEDLPPREQAVPVEGSLDALRGTGRKGRMVEELAAQQATARRLMGGGLVGQATVRATRETGALVNDNPEVQLDLLVCLADAEPYLVRHCQVLSRRVMGNFAPGARVPVRVDPDDPETLMIA